MSKYFHLFDIFNKAKEINFFRSMGTLPRPHLIDQWYSDQNNHISESCDHLGPDGDEENWRANYWKNFYRDITIKTKDWEYEQETRLILTSMLENLHEDEKRKLKYNFTSLKGIIFGINTSDDDKLRIKEIIKSKCRQNDHNDFKFYQAYYCHKSGKIRKYELSTLSKAVTWNENEAAI